MEASTQSLAEELEGYRFRCFWWVHPSTAVVNLSHETLITGLRTHGGWAGMRLAARLQAMVDQSYAPD